MNILKALVENKAIQKLSKTKVGRGVSTANTKTMQNSPDIWMVAGLLTLSAGAILLARAHAKKQEHMEDVETDLEELENEMEDGVEPEEIQYYRKEKAKAYAQYGVQLATLYGPPLAVWAVGTGMVLRGRFVYKRRQQGLIAALAITQQAFNAYRQKVREYNAELDEEFYTGGQVTTQKILTVTPDGKKKKKVEKKLTIGESLSPDMYARLFDQSNVNWSGSKEAHMFFLRSVESYSNAQLYIHGHVFLNSVYKQLGFEETREGAVVGWTTQGDGDHYISLGLENPINHDPNDPRLYLDFNVDGPILEFLYSDADK